MKHYILLIDASYSMSNYMYKIIIGLNSFLNRLRNQPQISYVTIAYFNSHMTYLHRLININDLPDLNYTQFSSFGSTALYDSVCTILNDSEFHSPVFNTHFYIVSDGEDCTSKIYNKFQMDTLCNKAKLLSKWSILYFHTDICMDMLEADNKVINLEDDLSSLFENMVV